MGELRLSCFGIVENTMYTINAIMPLLNPDISDSEARSVVDRLTDEQKDIAIRRKGIAFRWESVAWDSFSAAYLVKE